MTRHECIEGQSLAASLESSATAGALHVVLELRDHVERASDETDLTQPWRYSSRGNKDLQFPGPST